MSTTRARRISAVLGLAIWLAALAALPGPLIGRITLGAPLVVVPQLLVSHQHAPWAARIGGPLALAAASPLVVAFALPTGWAAALFTLPWVGLAAVAAAGAIRHGAPHLPGLLHVRRAVELGADAALGFLLVGAAFVLFDRLGVRPLGFSSQIILLTATHFHFAGFGLLTVACMLALRRPALGAAILGLAVGFPLTAAGFILASPALNAIGALIVGVGGTAVAIALIADAGSDWLAVAPRVAGLALLIGVPMGIGWSWSIWLGFDFVGLDEMVRTHGVLNAAGVSLAALAHGTRTP